MTAEANYAKDPSDRPELHRVIHGLVISQQAIHREIHGHGISQQAMAGGFSASSNVQNSKKKNSDLKYDIFGWIILAVGIVTWVGMTKSQILPFPLR